MKKKVKLNELQVKSFVTSIKAGDEQTILGGDKKSQAGRVCALSVFIAYCDEKNTLHSDCC